MKAKNVAPAVQIIGNKADLIKLIDSIATRGKKLDKDIHQAAVSSLVHAAQHGDITVAVRLTEALPKSGRKNALIAWLTSFGPFALGEGNKLVYKKLEDGQLNVQAASAEPFWEFAPEPAYVPFDLKAQIEKLIGKAEKAAADPEHAAENAVDLAVVSLLKRIVEANDA